MVPETGVLFSELFSRDFLHICQQKSKKVLIIQSKLFLVKVQSLDNVTIFYVTPMRETHEKNPTNYELVIIAVKEIR